MPLDGGSCVRRYSPTATGVSGENTPRSSRGRIEIDVLNQGKTRIATYTSKPGPYGLIRLASKHPTRVRTNGRAAYRLRELSTLAAIAQPRSTKPVKNEPCRLAHSAVAGGSSHSARVSLRHSERI